MSEYVLTASRFDQVLERDATGRPTKVIKHRPGATITGLSDSEVDRLLRAGAITPAGSPPPAEPTPEQELNAAVAPVPGGTAEPPKKTAPTAEWVDYAVARGLDRAEAEAMNKPDLIKAVG